MEYLPKLKCFYQEFITYSNLKIIVSQNYVNDKVQLLKTQLSSQLSHYDNNTKVAAAATACVATCVLGLTYVSLKSRKKKSSRAPQDTATMKGIGINSYDGFQGVTIVSLDIPEVKRPDDVLIRVVAASIDTMDFKISCGYSKRLRRHITKYRQNSTGDFPVVLGRDCVGIVLAAGEDATEFAVGDEVWAISPPSHQGYMSQVIVVPKSLVDYKPINLSFEDAAVLPYSAAITCCALSKGGLNPRSAKGKRILVHDGSSPVGSLAIQLIKLWDGHVTTTITKAAIPLAINMGVNDIVVHDIEFFTVELHKRKKFDVVLNTIGLILHDWCKEIVTKKGTVISLVSGQSSSEKYGIFFGAIYSLFCYMKSLFAQRIVLGNDVWLSNLEMTARPLEHFRQLVELEQIRPITDSVWPLEDYEAAFKRALHSECLGKVVIRFD